MSSFSGYTENAVLNHVFRNTPLTSPAAVYLALYTAAPTDAGGGTQVTGGDYARQAITFGAPAGGVISNSAELLFEGVGGESSPVVAVGIFDALTGGNLLAWDAIESAAYGLGSDIRFAVGSINLSLT